MCGGWCGFLDADGVQFDVEERLVFFVDADLLDVADGSSALDDASKHCMFVVEPRTGHGANVKLGSICVRAAVSHREREGSVVSERRMEFVAELTPPNRVAASAVAVRVSRLHHEALDDSVEN